MALILAFSLCQIAPGPEGAPRGPSEPVHSPAETRALVEAATEFYRGDRHWQSLPQPPPAWVKLEVREAEEGLRYRRADKDDERVPLILARPGPSLPPSGIPNTPAKSFPLIPLQAILTCPAKGPFLDFSRAC